MKMPQLTLNEKGVSSDSENFLELIYTYTVRGFFKNAILLNLLKVWFFFILMGNLYLIEKIEHNILSLMFPREACHSLDHMLNIGSKHRI